MKPARLQKLCLGLAIAAGLAGCATRTQEVNWNLAGPAFLTGEEQAPMAYSEKAAARCVGRWQVHHDALDSFTISISAVHMFPNSLRQISSLSAAEFFRLDPIDERANRKGAEQAQKQLRRALAGDMDAFRLYFEALGKCSTKPEAVDEANHRTVEVPAGGPAGE